MRPSAMLVVVVSALMSPTVTLGYTFGDWAADHGYSAGAAMPARVEATESSISSLNGISEFDWTTTPTTTLSLCFNQLTSIESGAFTGLTNLTTLDLSYNQLTSLESGDFDGLTNLKTLCLFNN